MSAGNAQQVEWSKVKTLTLAPESKEIALKTAPVVAENLSKIVSTFYPRMFKTNPEVLQFFNTSNQATGRQQSALAGSVVAAVSHLDHLDHLRHELMVIGHKHCGLGILPHHYQIVHDNFLGAVAQVLGDAVTPEVGKAWSDVLMHLAAACIEVENQIYVQSAGRPGNWHGKEAKPFKIEKIVDEAESVKSFYLKPEDGSPVPDYTPGQFATLHVNPHPETTPLMAPRHYTISSPKPIDGCLRITVRELTGTPAGQVSSWLHQTAKVGDVIKVRPPFGIFTRDYNSPGAGTDEVYLSAGIGLTTVAAMAPLAIDSGVKTAWFHCEVNQQRHALRSELGALKWSLAHYHYNDGDANKHFQLEEALKMLNEAGFSLEKTRFMVCGPPSFMQTIISGLKKTGVSNPLIHHEAFGPAIKV